MLSTITDFKIKLLNIQNLPDELFIFTNKCKEQGMKNNESIEAMKIGRWGNEAWWVTWYNNQIISISGCHQFHEYHPNCWRLMVRTATLKEFRGRAPGSIKLIHKDFNWGHILPYQIRYAYDQGAAKLVFTTNSTLDGEKNSYRTNKIVQKVLEPQGIVRLLERDKEIFYVKQNVWEILSGSSVV